MLQTHLTLLDGVKTKFQYNLCHLLCHWLPRQHQLLAKGSYNRTGRLTIGIQAGGFAVSSTAANHVADWSHITPHTLPQEHTTHHAGTVARCLSELSLDTFREPGQLLRYSERLRAGWPAFGSRHVQECFCAIQQQDPPCVLYNVYCGLYPQGVGKVPGA
jgi:hypothetical protein